MTGTEACPYKPLLARLYADFFYRPPKGEWFSTILV